MTAGHTPATSEHAPTPGTELEGIRQKVFLDRYALKGEDGTPLEQYPEQMWRRVARGIAAVEPSEEKRAEWADKFYGLLSDFKFVPGGRILSGAGTGHEVTYYNCYVVGLGEDPLNPDAPRKPMLAPDAARPAFFNALAQMTDIMSRSGGVGINLSALPPRGTPIAAEGRGASGPVRPTVALSLAHPDVERLLDEKDGPNLAHVDVAVIVPPAFDAALAADADWTPCWGEMAGATVKARALWARVTDGAGKKVAILRPDAAMLTIEDSRDAIVAGAAEAARLLYHGTAPVVDFSPLRPKGAYIKTVNGTSSGPVAWMYLYDAVGRLDDGAAPAEKGVVWFGEIASVITGKTIQQGGCFGPGQRIATSRGLLRASDLANLIDAGEKVEALTHQGPRPIAWSFRNGTKPLWRVTTARGFTVDVTAEHKMGILRGGKLTTVPLADLEAGDDVLLFLGEKIGGDYLPLETPPYDRSVMSTCLNENVRLPEILDEKLAYFLGYLHGDGYVHWGRKVTWRAPKAIKLATADAHPSIRTQLVEYVRELFNLEPIVEDHTGEACRDVAIYSRILIEWLEHNGLLKAHSEAVRVPEAIFRSPSPVMAAFVAGYFDADGSDRGRKNGYGFDSVSLEMLRDIQQLLAANGILSHVHTTDRSAQGWRTIHRLVVTGAEFKARMNLFLAMVHKNRGREGFRNHHNGYPRDVWPELNVPGRYYQGLWDSTKPRISYRALTRVQDRLVVKGEVALAERIEQLLHTVPDHIVSIEPLGLSEVFDFEVTDVHMLSGNGIYASNSRRGALMLMLDDDHPDVLEFIAAKKIDPATNRPVMIEHANMSVCASDAFMAAVKADLPWDLKWQGQVVRTVRAREIWDAICTAAWTTAEPGLVFMERAQKEANTWYFENIRCVNPCGEQPLPAGGVCNLGAINLERYVDDDGRLLEDDLARDAAYATRFLDDVIDATPYFSELHVKMQREGTRRTGLGTMGLADALIKMEVAYGSAESEEAIDRIYGIIRDASYGESVRLAAEKGSFGRFDREKYLQGRFIKRLPHDLQEDIREHGIRNGVILTQAPTGTTSLLAGVSSGIEPVFDFAMKRVDRLGEHIIYHPLLEAWMKEHPGEERPAYFVGAKDLTPEEHVVVQAKVQEYTDSSISKCVTGETLVASERGLLPIADLYAGEAPDAFRTLPLRVASLQGEQTASHFYYGGKRPALAVRLADGRAISGTGNHRVYVGNAEGLSWKRLDELAPGDYVAVKIGAQRFGIDVPLRGFEQSTTRAGYQKQIQVPASMNPRLAHFIGSWCAEGDISHYTVRITNNEQAVLERLNDEARLLFGIEGTVVPQGNSNALTLSINSKSLCELLRFLGCRDGARHKVVPWSILQSSRESVIAFLSGLYLDGYVTPAKVGICLASRVIIEQVQIILDNLGVQSWITPKHNKVYARDYYELNAHGQEGQKLARLLAFDETHKVERARLLLQRSFGASRTDVIPLEARESVFGVGSGASRTVRYRHHAYSQALSGQQEGRMLSWGGLRRLANDPEVALTADLRAIVENNLHFRQVLSVQDAGVQEVYDLTVPANHAFVANGIVNHNTANAPHDHTVEEVKRLYTLAYDLGCKGVTYYRDGSRDAVLTSVTEAKPAAAATPDAAPALTTPDDGATAPAITPAAPATLLPEPVAAPPIVSSPAMPAWIMEGRLKRRPSEMAGFTRNVAAPEGKVNITINQDDDGPLEVFINIGRAGSDVAALAEALGRLISLQLRLPSTMSQEERLRQVANQLRGIGGSRSIGFGANRVQSLPDAVAQAIYRHLEEHPVPPPATPSVPVAQLALPVSETLPLSQAPLFPAGNPTPAGGTAPAATAMAGSAAPTSAATAAAPEASVATATVAATPVINGNGHSKPEAAHVPVAVLTGNLCPQCGSSGAYVYEEGCKKCHNCGYSEC